MTTRLDMEGVPLARFCDRDALLPLETVLELVARAAEALGDAHRAGVVHGSLAPAHLLRVGDAAVRIAGFGEAPTPVGRTSVLPEAPNYLSPEQVRGLPPDPRSDLFSLGAVLFELVTGTTPFPGESTATVLYRIVNEAPVVDPSLLARPVPAALEPILSRLLAKRPDDRFSSGGELAESLRRAAIGLRVDERCSLPAPSIERPAAAEPSPAPPARQPRRPPAGPGWVAGGAALLLALAAIGRLALRGHPARPADGAEPVWSEAVVRTDPPGLAVEIDGVPLDSAAGGRVRFRADGPLGLLTARLSCREVRRRLEPADAGGEIVLVPDPVALAWTVDPGVRGARVRLDGKELGTAPLELKLDLCRDHRLEISAADHRPATLALTAGATPLEARTALYGLRLERLPLGRLLLPTAPGLQLAYEVDGRRIDRSRHEIELAEGAHELRIRNDHYWIDVRTKVEVVAGQTLRPEPAGLSLATLVVQAFPANCQAYLRRPGGSWKHLDETPVERRLAAGRYQVKVVLQSSGETVVRDVELTPGANPPVRVAFGQR